MINARMRVYDYYLIGEENDYGQETVIKDDNGNPLKQGEITISISTLTQTVTEDLRYSEATYIGITHDKNVSDKYIIQHGDEKLKVLYVNKETRFPHVFLGVYEY